MFKKGLLYLFIFLILFPAWIYSVDKQHYLSLSIDGVIKDEVHSVPFFGSNRKKSLRNLLIIIKKAEENSKIKGIILKINSPIIGFAKLQEIREALQRFRQKGKTIYAFSETYSNINYLLASVADKLYISPQGNVELTGIALELVFFKNTLDLLGIKANFHQIGDYKSASEPYTHTESSEFQKSSINQLLDGLYQELVLTVSKSRKIPVKKVKTIINRGFYTAEEAQKVKLIDDYIYEDVFFDMVKKKGIVLVNYYDRTKRRKKRSGINIFTLFSKSKPAKKSRSPKIAVVFTQGVIMSGRSRVGLFESEAVGSGDFVRIFRQLRQNPLIKAVIIRIDSPGGSALAADVMWREIKLLSKAKPVIASLSDVAASGGYYLAMACPTIVANSTTITGSIGVVGGKFNLKGLYDKIGLKKEIFKRGQHADLFSDYRDWTPQESELILKLMKHTYKTFVSKAAKGRAMSFKKMDKIAQGKIYTGTQAFRIGLVDKIGGLDQAIDMARKKVKDSKRNFEVVSYPEKRTFMDYLKANLKLKTQLVYQFRELQTSLGPVLWYFQYAQRIVSKERIALLVPFFLKYN